MSGLSRAATGPLGRAATWASAHLTARHVLLLCLCIGFATLGLANPRKVDSTERAPPAVVDLLRANKKAGDFVIALAPTAEQREQLQGLDTPTFEVPAPTTAEQMDQLLHQLFHTIFSGGATEQTSFFFLHNARTITDNDVVTATQALGLFFSFSEIKGSERLLYQLRPKPEMMVHYLDLRPVCSQRDCFVLLTDDEFRPFHGVKYATGTYWASIGQPADVLAEALRRHVDGRGRIFVSRQAFAEFEQKAGLLPPSSALALVNLYDDRREPMGVGSVIQIYERDHDAARAVERAVAGETKNGRARVFPGSGRVLLWLTEPQLSTWDRAEARVAMRFDRPGRQRVGFEYYNSYGGTARPSVYLDAEVAGQVLWWQGLGELGAVGWKQAEIELEAPSGTAEIVFRIAPRRTPDQLGWGAHAYTGFRNIRSLAQGGGS